ncbi:hypothetical protein H0N95_01535 [Candidatus Micrarchaeota archaeon]|nr:hypothetical protein [Candidatus Micrarchaeota archaeon]
MAEFDLRAFTASLGKKHGKVLYLPALGPDTRAVGSGKSKIALEPHDLIHKIDLAVYPQSAEEREMIKKKAEEIGLEGHRKWFYTRAMGHISLSIAKVGKKQEPALLISEVQPGMYWEMPSKFREKYKDWYKNLYDEIEKKANENGIKKIIMSTPRAIREKTTTLMPYHMLDQLYYAFPKGKGFKKEAVPVREKTRFSRPTETVKRKLWLKRLGK